MVKLLERQEIVSSREHVSVASTPTSRRTRANATTSDARICGGRRGVHGAPAGANYFARRGRRVVGRGARVRLPARRRQRRRVGAHVPARGEGALDDETGHGGLDSHAVRMDDAVRPPRDNRAVVDGMHRIISIIFCLLHYRSFKTIYTLIFFFLMCASAETRRRFNLSFFVPSVAITTVTAAAAALVERFIVFLFGDSRRWGRSRGMRFSFPFVFFLTTSLTFVALVFLLCLLIIMVGRFLLRNGFMAPPAIFITHVHGLALVARGRWRRFAG